MTDETFKLQSLYGTKNVKIIDQGIIKLNVSIQLDKS